jgi:hypothetical protein
MRETIQLDHLSIGNINNDNNNNNTLLVQEDAPRPVYQWYARSMKSV